jgi:cation transport ATPase
MAEKDPKKEQQKDDQEFERLSDEEKIESLIASLEKETPKKEKKPTPKKETPKPDEKGPSKRSKLKNRMIMIKFGGAYHANFYLNLVIAYWVNLVLVVGILDIFNLGRFPDQIWIPMVFVLMYTGFEFLFREWMVQRFSQWVLLSFGLIFFVGYSTLFFIIDALFFTNVQIFNSEIELVAFTGLFMIARYLISWVIKKGLDWRR